MSGARPDFASFPRARLKLQWNRRQLLTSLTTELRVRSERGEGGADLKLPDLGLFPDDLIELLTPIVRDGYIPEGENEFRRAVALMMTGDLTIAQIARRLEAEIGWDAQRAFQYARGVFLHLVSEGQCLPLR